QKGAPGLTVKDVDDVEKPFALDARGKAKSYGRKDGASLSVPVASSPGLVSLLGSLSTRKQDLIVGPNRVTPDERVIVVPPGMHVETLPESKQVQTPCGSVDLNVESQPGKVTVK